jgi:putative selenium metabolism hydrolase
LDYDRAWKDTVGNVVGLIAGGNGHSVMFNAHLDHVAPGDRSLWPYPPYEGHIGEDHIWGRGASDVKGALAAQVYALGALKEAGLEPAGDCYLAGVVMEEIGGLGTRKLIETVRPDYAILGEATENNLARGHRGRVELVARALGRSVHASVPHRGVNPHYTMARFLLGLQEIEMIEVEPFGPATVAPTLSGTDQTSSNVTPRKVYCHLDWRSLPGENTNEILAKLERLMEDSLIAGGSGVVELFSRRGRTYTGYTETYPVVFPPFELSVDHPLVTDAQTILTQALDRDITVDTWNFTTDGGHLMAEGIPTIGFAPGFEAYCHTVQDRVSIDLLLEAMVGYMALALELGT